MIRHKKIRTTLILSPLLAALPALAGDSIGSLSGEGTGLLSGLAGAVGSAGSQIGDFANSLTGNGSAGTSPWEVTGAANLALAQGNADTFSYALQGLATYQGDIWEGLIGADYLYSENADVVTSDSLRIFGQAQRLLSERTYLGLAGSYLRDDLADLDYRLEAAAVLGYHLIKNDRTTLSFEVGPGYVWQEQAGVTDNFPAIRFGQRFEHQLTKRSKIWQSAIITPNIEDFSDYFLTFDAGIDTLISSNWAARTSLRYLHDSTPSAGNSEGDLALLFGLSYSLGGFPEPEVEGRRSLKPDRAAPAGPTLGWTNTAALGVSLAKGNSDTLQATLAYDAARRTTHDEIFFNAGYSFGQNDGVTSTDVLTLGARHNRLLSDRLYFGAGIDFLRDDIAQVSYRLTPNFLFGYYVIKNDTMSLAFEGGPAYVFEEVAGVADNYFALRAAERFSWNIGPRLTFNQALIIDFDPGNFDNYLATLTAYLDADITDNLSWRLSGSYIYDNEPGAGLEESDLTLTSGIAVKF